MFKLIEYQKDIAKMLLNTKKQNRLSHAYIFNGLPGVGKKEMAYYFACMLYCTHEEGPCLKCSTCRTILNNDHLNVHYLEKDGMGIKKEQIANLQKEFSKTSLVEGPRIYIINEIDKISQAAANSLLKFIEEPIGVETYGILLTEDISMVLPTIVSRSAIVNFKAMNKKEMIAELEIAGIEENIAYVCASLTNNVVEAFELAAAEDTAVLAKLIELFLSIKNAKEAVIFMKDNGVFLDNMIHLKQFFSLLCLVYEDVIRLEYQEPLVLQFLKDKITRYKLRYTMNDIKNNFAYILELNSRLEVNVSSRNIIHLLMTHLY